MSGRHRFRGKSIRNIPCRKHSIKFFLSLAERFEIHLSRCSEAAARCRVNGHGVELASHVPGLSLLLYVDVINGKPIPGRNSITAGYSPSIGIKINLPAAYDLELRLIQYLPIV